MCVLHNMDYMVMFHTQLHNIENSYAANTLYHGASLSNVRIYPTEMVSMELPIYVRIYGVTYLPFLVSGNYVPVHTELQLVKMLMYCVA